MCGNRFNGAAKNVYLTIYEGDEKASWRYVVCPSCQESLTDDWRERALYRDEHGQWTFPEEAMAWVAFFQPSQPPERAYERRNGSQAH